MKVHTVVQQNKNLIMNIKAIITEDILITLRVLEGGKKYDRNNNYKHLITYLPDITYKHLSNT